jgi:uncharacterized membrane protein YcaP (DUF421 family)
MLELAPNESVLTILLRSGLVYVAVLVGLRLSGKRELGQLTVLDFVVLLLIANAVQNAMVGPDTSVVGGLLAGATLLGLNGLLSYLRVRSPRLRRALVGSPTVLVMHGEMQVAAMRREGIDDDMLTAVLREHGLPDVSEVELVVLETDGAISVVPMHAANKRIHHFHQRTNTDSTALH